MRKERGSIEVLIEYFNMTEWPPDVHESKLRNRSSVRTDQAMPGWEIVEVERHRAVAGATYTRGFPMSAFETYYMRYAVRVSDAQVEHLSERSGGKTIDVAQLVAEHLDWDHFSLSIDTVSETEFLICESVSNDKARISTLDEAVAFALAQADTIGESLEEALDQVFESDGDNDSQARAKMLRDCEEEVRSQLKRKTEAAWREREPWVAPEGN